MIQNDLEVILSRYTQARTGEPFKREHELFSKFKAVRDALSQSEAVRSRPHLRVKYSVGQGNWARVPWIALLDKRETATTQRGVYCVYLFRQDMSGVYITFNQGVTELIKQKGRTRAHQELQQLAKAAHQFCTNLSPNGFSLGEGIDLRADPGLGVDYEYSTIAYKFYEVSRIPTDAEIINDLEATLKAYDDYLIERPSIPMKSTENHNRTVLPKPFLLLAGISGTGKTRFVREQAEASAGQYCVENRENYCLVPVRPDWHEPSDLLGYISRIGEGGARYVVTDLLRFIVAAWKHTTESASSGGVVYKPFETVSPFWLCLDEMNLAPVEQYFADYLSILETRKWEAGNYSCDPLLKKDVIDTLKEDGKAQFWSDLKIADDSGLIEYFSNYGIPLPPNLIVAGTVNMDETTHGFSRKVIDRALTLDFGEFYPNDYNEFFKQTILPKTLGFPVLSQVKQDSLSEEYTKATINFLKEVNTILVGTPFELAYRALNEALLAVACFKPAKPDELQAVWDDFLMMKVLPRIEGDAEKLGFVDESSLLTKLAGCLETLLPAIWDTARPDQLREYVLKGPILLTKCRSKHKLAWMQKRLADNGFTTFWP